MHLASQLFPLSLGLLDFDGRALAVLIPIAGILLAGVISVSAMYFSHHEKQMLHETARLALEKGQPLSPAIIETLSHPAQHKRSHGRNDIRSGLVLVAVGVGLYLFSSHIDRLRFVGAIPGLIGVALLLYGMLEALFSRKHRPDDRSPLP